MNDHHELDRAVPDDAATRLVLAVADRPVVGVVLGLLLGAVPHLLAWALKSGLL